MPATFGASDGLAWLMCMKDHSTDVKTPARLPPLLSLDNLGTGVALNSASAPMAAVTVGTIRAWMAAWGFAVGAARLRNGGFLRR